MTLQFPEKRTKCDGPITASIAIPPDQAEVESSKNNIKTSEALFTKTETFYQIGAIFK